jgi:hypothetical protein
MGEITDPRVAGNRIAIGRTGFYDFDHPELSEFELDDILIGLSRIYRFTGQSGITVLQHSINVYHAAKQLGANREKQRQALFHDAHEAFVGDWSRPLLKKLALDAAIAGESSPLDEYDRGARYVVADRFSFDPVLSDVVKAADDHVLALEIFNEFDVDPATWGAPPNKEASPFLFTQIADVDTLFAYFHTAELDTRDFSDGARGRYP